MRPDKILGARNRPSAVIPAKAGIQCHVRRLDSGLRRNDLVVARPSVRRTASQGFVLPAAIFLLVVMATLSAFLVQVTAASNIDSAADIQGARAYQAARLGIETGLYAVQVSGTCSGGTLSGVGGLTGFKVTWACSSTAFTEAGTARTIYQITSTACSTSGGSCPSATVSEMQSSDYVERQLVVVTER